MIKNFVKNQKILYVIIFLTGLILGYILGLFKFHNLIIYYLKHFLSFKFIYSFFDIINSLSLNTDFLQDVIAFEGVLVGVAIPISFQVVLSMVKEYDRDIAGFFTKEPLYKAQYVLFLLNIAISIIFRFFQISNVYALIFMLVWSIINIIIFVYFVILVHKYITDTDKVILGKLWKHATNIFEK